MKEKMGIEARLAWAMLFEKKLHLLEEPLAQYGNLDLDLLNACELLDLMKRVRSCLEEKGIDASVSSEPVSGFTTVPDTIYIDKQYRLFRGSGKSEEIVLQPMLKTVFLFFLKHSEGVLMKDKADYREELDAIYGKLCPTLDCQVRQRRIARLVSAEDNSFSEKLSSLNKMLDSLFGQPLAENYKVRGKNGQPRRIPLDPLYIDWE